MGCDSGSGRRNLAAAVIAAVVSALALLGSSPGYAQDNGSDATAAASGPDWLSRHGAEKEQPPQDIWHRDTLTGDWNGLRSRLADRGITFSLTYTADLQGNLRGGIRNGAVYDGVFEPEVDIDLEKLVGWSGASMSFSALQLSGPSLSSEDVGNLLDVSGINARPATRLYNAWFQQDDAGRPAFGAAWPDDGRCGIFCQSDGRPVHQQQLRLAGHSGARSAGRRAGVSVARPRTSRGAAADAQFQPDGGDVQRRSDRQ